MHRSFLDHLRLTTHHPNHAIGCIFHRDQISRFLIKQLVKNFVMCVMFRSRSVVDVIVEDVHRPRPHKEDGCREDINDFITRPLRYSQS